MQFTVKQASPEGAVFICVINMHLILVACNYQKAVDRHFYWRQKKREALELVKRGRYKDCSLEQLALFLAEGSQLLYSFRCDNGWTIRKAILCLMRLIICLGWDWGEGLEVVKRPFADLFDTYDQNWPCLKKEGKTWRQQNFWGAFTNWQV